MSGSRKSLKKATTFNPRASNDWSKDESKFGLKMLEKMGWKQGQGIGLNNQGITENIKVRLKLDSKGLGYQIKEDQWLEVRSEFSELLSQLSQGVEDEDEALEKGKKSLRAVSESSKTRVHYHKFTHGKDIARYKKEDLIGILGKKEKDDSLVPENKEFIQSGNMDEYFKSKKRKLEPADSNFSPADNLQVDDITDHDSTDSMKSVKKKKLENDDVDFPSTDDAGEILDHNSENSLKPVKKKKKKLENLDENLPSTENSQDCDILDHGSDSKSAKKKKLENGDRNLPSADNSTSCNTLNNFDSVTSGEKKKRLENTGQDTTCANNWHSCDILEDNSVNSKSEKKKKKKKAVEISDLNLPSAENSQACEIIDQSSGNSVKSAKKTKKIKNSDQNISSPNSSQPCNIIDENSADLKTANLQNIGHNLPSESSSEACDILDPSSTDNSKSKKKKLENSHLNPSTNNSQISDQSSIDSSKRVKKKKKKLENIGQNLPSAHDLQACDIFNQSSEDCLKSKEKRTANSDQNLSSVSDLQTCNIIDQNSIDFTKTAKKKKKKKLENSDQNLPAAKNSRTIKIIDQNSADFMKSVIDYNSCNNVEDIISKFEKSREELLNKYREKYIKKYSESSSGIKVFGDEFDGRKLDCKKPTNEDESVMQMYARKNKSKADRAVAKAILVRSIEEGVVTHDFEGSNLTNIPGYGSKIC